MDEQEEKLYNEKLGRTEDRLSAKINALDSEVKALAQQMNEMKHDMRELLASYRHVFWALVALAVTIAFSAWGISRYDEDRIVARVLDALNRQSALIERADGASARVVPAPTATAAPAQPAENASADVAGVPPSPRTRRQ
ncbi:MAG: hypothetical protein LBR38_00465 [Synergistaceae bacterium]|jgi:hypothetical protein|nr:hypothetical protein [Synergistaceae bacterium]